MQKEPDGTGADSPDSPTSVGSVPAPPHQEAGIQATDPLPPPASRKRPQAGGPGPVPPSAPEGGAPAGGPPLKRARRARRATAAGRVHATAAAAGAGAAAAADGRSTAGPGSRRATLSAAAGGRATLHEGACFSCADAAAGAPDVLCAYCPKAFHLGCLGLAAPPGRRWACPWHRCRGCSKNHTLNRCVRCPTAFCACCLPPGSLRLRGCPEMDALGHRLPKQSKYCVCADCVRPGDEGTGTVVRAHDDVCFRCQQPAGGGLGLAKCRCCTRVCHRRCLRRHESPGGNWICPGDAASRPAAPAVPVPVRPKLRIDGLRAITAAAAMAVSPCGRPPLDALCALSSLPPDETMGVEVLSVLLGRS